MTADKNLRIPFIPKIHIRQVSKDMRLLIFKPEESLASRLEDKNPFFPLNLWKAGDASKRRVNKLFSFTNSTSLVSVP